MNRPQKNEYWVFDETEKHEVFMFDAYERDLENYCDALEKGLDWALCKAMFIYGEWKCTY